MPRARELLETSLHETVVPDRLARECSLSVPHFTRVFTATVGTSAGVWRRVHIQECHAE
jgi:AraC-like DNA-binding protein